MRVIGFCLLATLVCAPARADTILFEGSGEILDDDFLATFEAGDPVSFSFEYELGLDALSVDPTFALYQDPGGLSVVVIGTPTGAHAWGCIGLEVSVANDHVDLQDGLSITAHDAADSFCPTVDFGAEVLALDLILQDPSGQAFASSELPDGPLDPADFEVRGVIVEGCLLIGCDEFDFDHFEMVASVDALTATVTRTPEPPQTLLGLVGMGTVTALAALRRSYG